MNNRENGSIAVLVALSLTLLIGLSVFVTDLGIIYVRHARLQNALDAAVLAGAQELPTSTTSAQIITEEYASNNNVSQISVDFGANNTEIGASAQEIVPALFSKIWGIEENTISASAKAKIVPPENITEGLVPLCLKKQDLTYGTEYELKVGAGDFLEPGWFGCLDFTGGSGASDVENFIENGYPGNIGMNDIIHVQHGVVSIPVKRAINDRLDSDTRVPQNTFADHERDAPQILYVPIVEVVSTDGVAVNEVRVSGFAAFFVESAGGTGLEAVVKGRFLKTIVVKGKSTGSSPASDFGLYAVKLIS